MGLLWRPIIGLLSKIERPTIHSIPSFSLFPWSRRRNPRARASNTELSAPGELRGINLQFSYDSLFTLSVDNGRKLVPGRGMSQEGMDISPHTVEFLATVPSLDLLKAMSLVSLPSLWLDPFFQLTVVARYNQTMSLDHNIEDLGRLLCPFHHGFLVLLKILSHQRLH